MRQAGGQKCNRDMEETHFFNITYRRKSVPKVARRHANRGLTYATTQKLLLPSEPTGRATHLRTRRSRTCSLTLSKNQKLGPLQYARVRFRRIYYNLYSEVQR